VITGVRYSLQPLCAWIIFVRPFVVIDDKGGERLIKALDVFHVLSLYLEICTVAVVCLVSFTDVSI
jgi:hypothetical protein